MAAEPRQREQKKAGVVENPQVIDHAGLLYERSPGLPELPFVQSSDKFKSSPGAAGRLCHFDSQRTVVMVGTAASEKQVYSCLYRYD
jgi:hypothetical protein